MDTRERKRLYLLALYAKRKAAGLCPRCGCKPTPPFAICPYCRRQQSASRNKLHTRIENQPSSRAS